LLNATLLPPYRWRKKKGIILPPDRFKSAEQPKQEVAPQRLPQKTVEPPTTIPAPADPPKAYKIPPIPTPIVEEKTPPKINISSPTKGKQISGLSLSSIQKKKEWDQVQKKEEKVEDLPTEAFSQEDLNEAWKKYQNLKSEKGEQNIASLFNISSPLLLEEYLIEYSVPNSLNKVELEREFTYFLPFLRERLQNYSLRIQIKINEESEKSFIYTAEEKYERFKEINPAIEQLKKELDLDL